MSEFDAPVGYLTLSPDGTIREVNDWFLALTGHGRDELVDNKRFSELLSGGGRIYHETHFAPLLQMQGHVHGIAFEIVCADGSQLPVLVNAALERDSNDEPVVIRAVVFGALERRAYERELLRAKEEAEAAEARVSALARTLQQTLIPPGDPEIPGLDVAAAYRPAGRGDEVGGDFYDVFQVDDDDWVVVVGDVQGKGAAAAVVTALVRHTVRAAAVLEQEPSEILDTVNTVMLRDATERFCTLVLLRLMRIDDTWRATIGLGGHSLPILSRQGRPALRIGEPGLLIGVWPQAEPSTLVIVLEPGDTVLLYTDGITEARRGSEFFGDSRLLELVSASGSDAKRLVDDVVAGAIDFQYGITRDDIAVVAVGVPA